MERSSKVISEKIKNKEDLMENVQYRIQKKKVKATPSKIQKIVEEIELNGPPKDGSFSTMSKKTEAEPVLLEPI